MSKLLSDIIFNSGENDNSDEDIKLSVLQEQIDLISDPKVKSFVKSALLKATPFWQSSSSMISPFPHPPDELSDDGMILHTKRVVRIVFLLINGYDIPAFERDILLAAAILHDVTKAIWGDEEKTMVVHDSLHPYTADSFIEWCLNEDLKLSDSSQYHTLDLDTDSIQNILRLIRCSHGPWSPIPETIPISMSEKILHTADLIAANLHSIIDGENIKEERWNLQI